MRRRAVLGSGAMALAGSALAMPALAKPASILRFVPSVDPPALDPVINTAAEVRNQAFLVFDTLYGLDEDYVPQPQMLSGHSVTSDGLAWTLTLRDGLWFHDGTPVLARDVVASIRRWGAVDGFGAVLLAAVQALEPEDDRTIRIRLKRPFPMLPAALGKMSPAVCAIMPERLALLPATRPVPEIVGSGPFRLVESERVPGSRIVYERFTAYVPRPGMPGLTSGAKRVELDRVEWLVTPEPAMAARALQAGEVDWLEAPLPDLLPTLRRDPGLVVAVNDPAGVLPILRFNCVLPPFDNVAIRRAVLSAVDRGEFMAAYSDDAANLRNDVGIFCPGAPMATTAGLDQAIGVASIPQARQAITAAGYKGEQVVMLEPTDHPVSSVMAQVGADLFRKLGLNVDVQAMDAGTMYQRRANRGVIDRGGWNCFPSAVAGIDVLDPAVSFLVRGNGPDAWYGWPTDPALEALRLSWFDAQSVAEQRAIAKRIQLEVLAQALYLPLGQVLQPTAYRRNIKDVLPGFAKFWSVRKT